MKKVISSLCIALLSLNASQCFASCACYGGAKEGTQLANKAQLIKQVAEAVEQTKQQIQMYLNMVKNTMQLPEQIWSDATKEFEKLTGEFKSAYSAMFGLDFDIGSFSDSIPTFKCSDGNADHEDFEKRYEEIRNKTNEFERDIAASNGLRLEDLLGDSQRALERFRDANQSADGQMKALQLANDIAIFTAQQLTKMESTMLRGLSVALANQQAADEKADAALQGMKDYIGKPPQNSEPTKYDPVAW